MRQEQHIGTPGTWRNIPQVDTQERKQAMTQEAARQAYARAWADKERAESGIAAGCAHGLAEYTAAESAALKDARARMAALEPFLAATAKDRRRQ